ncbi:peroxiredoxin family protein [Aliikangiella maris]|uniref:TlpA disulfide reductase family protein n=2 Tax=Aliikangiella maris TaxID=3162458 RepID=A0ABV3MUN2_9GAMM
MNKLQINLIIFFLLFGVTTIPNAEEDTPGEGAVAPDFQITQMDGTTFKLSDFKGEKPVYLIFWNTWCTFCMKKIPHLQRTYQEFNKDIQVIAINTSLKDSFEQASEFKQRFAIEYPLAFDHGKKVTDLYGVWGTPTEFIIDINGTILHRDNVPLDITNHLEKWRSSENIEVVAKPNTSCQQNLKTC